VEIYDRLGVMVGLIVAVDHDGLDMERAARAALQQYGPRGHCAKCSIYEDDNTFVREVIICGETCG
jgi:hypothetical protein